MNHLIKYITSLPQGKVHVYRDEARRAQVIKISFQIIPPGNKPQHFFTKTMAVDLLDLVKNPSLWDQTCHTLAEKAVTVVAENR